MSIELTTVKSLLPVAQYLPNLKISLQARTKVPQMPISCLAELNDKLWGFHKRKFYIIAARPSIGKSGFAIQLAYDQAMQGKRVLFLSLEMNVEDILERLFCHVYKVDNQVILRGGFNKYEQDFEDFCQKVNRMKFVISDCIGHTHEEIDNILLNLETKPDIIFIDHLNAIKSLNFNAKVDIDNYIQGLCTMAKKNNIVMVLCCQINRDNQKDDDKTPQLHELKGSGNIEEAADVVLMLHWPYKYKRNDKKDENITKKDYIVIVGKNRNGPTGYIDLHFKPELYLWSDARKAPAIEQPTFED